MSAQPRLTLVDLLSLTAVLVMAAGGTWVLLNGPAGPIPVHFGPDGTPDRWGDRTEVGLMFLILAATAAVVCAGFSVYARRAADAARRRGLLTGQAVAAIGLAATAAFVGALSLGGSTPSPLLQMAGAAVLFLVIGAFLGRVGPNVAVGVRTPWTYKSKLAWERSNRLAGRLFVLLGLAGVAAAPFAPQPAGLQLLLGAVMVAAAWSVFESWRVWRADPDRQPF